MNMLTKLNKAVIIKPDEKAIKKPIRTVKTLDFACCDMLLFSCATLLFYVAERSPT
jgi:hypothetical protein